MRKLPFIVFFCIMITAVCSSVLSYQKANSIITEDVNKALGMAMMEMPDNVVSTDTIQCYRSHLTIAELRDTASIAMRTVRRNDKLETELVAEANCNFLTVFKLSDQKSSGVLMGISILWLMGSLWYMRRKGGITEGIVYGGIVYNNEKFMTTAGTEIRLTPMQHSLMEMFMHADTHCLSKQEICDRLWPKKPDANDTLYTLIRRIKPIIETNSNLKIESDRGRSYSLQTK